MIHMKTLLRSGASSFAVIALLSLSPVTAFAADPVDPGCTIHGAVTLGGMLTSSDLAINGTAFPGEGNWTTPFGEGAGLITCDAWNFQLDMASYAHSSSDLVALGGKDIDDTRGHFGGAAFWRDANVGSFGLSASRLNAEFFGKDNDYWRGGVFGEFYAGDQFTLGAGAHYFDSDVFISGKDHNGWELTANAKFYVMPEFSLSLQGDYMNSTFTQGANNIDFDGFAITGEAKYLVWDEGLSVFGGARYATRTISQAGSSLDINDLQGFVGLEFAFNSSGKSLVASDRSGKYDNTSVMHEKLPGYLSDIIVTSAAGGGP
jgi:hypothetical protein